jgi:hypothetical protein
MKRLLAALGWVVLRPDRTWEHAIVAELDAVPAGVERVRFALSATVGLLRIAGERGFARWSRNRVALAVAVAGGLIVGAIDVASPGRGPLRILVVTWCAAFGAARPRCALIGGALAGVAIGLAGRLAGPAGPYALDVGDAWWPVLPAIALSGLGGFVARRIAAVRRRRAA